MLKLTRVTNVTNHTGGIVDGFGVVFVPREAIRWVCPVPYGEAGGRSVIHFADSQLYVEESVEAVAAMFGSSLPPQS